MPCSASSYCRRIRRRLRWRHCGAPFAGCRRTRSTWKKQRKAFGYVPEYVADADTNEQVRKALHIDPEVTAFMRKFMTTH